MAEKGIRTNSSRHSLIGKQTINQLNKKQTAPDGREGDKEYQLIPTFPNWQTINQLNKKQTTPDGEEGDKDQIIPTFPKWQTINQFKGQKQIHPGISEQATYHSIE